MTNVPSAFGATVATAKTETEKHPVIGFNAQTGLYEDFIEAGIIDSTKMVCSALQVAASVAGLIITTEVAIAPLPDAEAPPSRHYGYDDF